MLLLFWSGFGVFSQLAFVRLFSTTAGETTYYGNIFFIIAFFSMSCGFSARRLGRFAYFIPVGLLLNYQLVLWLSTYNLLQHLPGEFQWAPFANTWPKDANFDLQLAVLMLCSSLAPVMVLIGGKQGECMLAGDYQAKGYILMAAGGILGALLFTLQNQLLPSQFLLLAVWSASCGWALWYEHRAGSRQITTPSRIVLVIVPILGMLIIGLSFSRHYYWSPYQRITTRDNAANSTIELYTNGFYISSIQTQSADTLHHEAGYYLLYLTPFKWLDEGDRALVLGSGGGTTDVREALYHGAQSVTAVEIDPEFVALGTRYDLEHTYLNPRVTLHIDDARRFLNIAQAKFDFIIMPFLDSQTNASNQSRFRLDSFLYTREGLRLVYSKLSDRGILFLSFATGTPWIRQRMFNVLQQATHADVRAYALPNAAQSFYVVTHGKAFAGFPSPFMDRTSYFARQPQEIITTDDWPFLYSQSKVIPKEHLRMIYVLCILMLCIFLICRNFYSAIRHARRSAPRALCAYAAFSGAAFFFIEIRTISALAPWFGSTYLSQAIVVMEIILASLSGALLALNFSLTRIKSAWVLLFFTIVSGFYAHGLFHPLDGKLPSALLFALVLLLPTFVAGYIYLRYLERLSSEAVLEMQLYNLMGGALGGLAECAIIVTGFQGSLWISATLYLLAFVAAQTNSWGRAGGVDLGPMFSRAAGPSTAPRRIVERLRAGSDRAALRAYL
jgi:spermidine synthase